jgi:hypothetical protein
MVIPAWARERITHESDAYLAEAQPSRDHSLDPIVRNLAAWPVYGDVGGVLLITPDGEVYCRDHNTMEVRAETDPRWRTLAWAAAVEQVPELRELLPLRPAGTPDCEACGGSGHVALTAVLRAWCGACWGLGWQSQPAPAPQ